MAKTKKATSKKGSAPQLEAVTFTATTKERLDYPTMQPPGSGGMMAWNNNVKINSCWSIAENNNAWLNVSGMGFRKIKETNTQAFLALLMIGVHARDKNSAVNLRTETDNKIYEMYVW